MSTKVTKEQRATIGRAVLAAFGTTPEEHRVDPGAMVGLHTGQNGVIALTILVPCSWIRSPSTTTGQAPIENVRRKS